MRSKIIVLWLICVLSLGSRAQTFTFAAVGDLMFNNLSYRQNSAYPLAEVAPILKKADLCFANLEIPLTTRGTRTPRKSAADIKARKQFVLRASPFFARSMQAAGIDVVSTANNHAMDYGVQGMEDTLHLMTLGGMKATGTGKTLAAARKPAIVSVKGVKIAFLAYLAFQSWGGLNACTPATQNQPGIAIIEPGDEGLKTLKQDVQAAKQQADMVFVSFHWGIERQPQPITRQKQLAHKAVDYGASMVIGHHPHVLQPYELYNNAPIIYSLGNFVAPNSGGALGETLILMTTWDGTRFVKAEFKPARIRGGSPQPLTGNAASQALAKFERQNKALK